MNLKVSGGEIGFCNGECTTMEGREMIMLMPQSLLLHPMQMGV